MVYNPFFVENLGRLVLLELYICCIKERGLFEGTVLRCCNGKSSSNTWIIFGRCGDKGNACEQVWLEDDGCV